MPHLESKVVKNNQIASQQSYVWVAFIQLGGCANAFRAVTAVGNNLGIV
jgi:hypothetical protein